MRNAITAAVMTTLALTCATAEARREPRRGYTFVRGQTEARVDYRFDVTPPPPTRAEQLRPLPSFAAPIGFAYLHNSIWNRIRDYQWSAATKASMAIETMSYQPTPHGPKTIIIIRR